MTETTKCILIRHGQSDINPMDSDRSPLNENGKSLALWLQEYLLGETKIENNIILLAENCWRCIQTLTPLAEKMNTEIRVHRSFTSCKDQIAKEICKILYRMIDERKNVVYCYRKEALPGLNKYFDSDSEDMFDLLNRMACKRKKHVEEDDLYQLNPVLEKDINGIWQVVDIIDNKHPKK